MKNLNFHLGPAPYSEFNELVRKLEKLNVIFSTASDDIGIRHIEVLASDFLAIFDKLGLGLPNPSIFTEWAVHLERAKEFVAAAVDANQHLIITRHVAGSAISVKQ